ncbi:putative oxidoreductase GLYR1 homolog [Trichonephila clavipes]|nr:putative oxidoreductase GLYR1 homolog [Trichonephila clavipes]
MDKPALHTGSFFCFKKNLCLIEDILFWQRYKKQKKNFKRMAEKEIDEIIAAGGTEPKTPQFESIKTEKEEEPSENTKTKKLVEEKIFSAVADDKKKKRTPKEKIKKPPQKKKRKLTEETCDKTTPRNNTYNPVGVYQPFNDRSMTGPSIEPSPVPVLDMSRANPIVQKKNIKATSKKIGFIGLGTMGQRIVKNLLESGHNVSIWNRTLDKCTPFVKAGAHKFLTPCDVVLNCDIIFCCVSGPEATKSVVFGNRGILQGFQKCKPATKLFVVLTALDPKTSKEIVSAVTSEGGNYLDAPISGSISDAEAGTLLITVAGESEFFNDCVTCFCAMSRDAFYLGSDIGSASIMHVCTSMVKSSATVAMAEAMSLAESAGFSKNSLQKNVNLSSMNCPLFREKGMAMATNNFTTKHSLKYQCSDLQILLKTSDAYAQHVPLAAAANEVFKKAMQLKYSDHDVSAVYFGAKPLTK